MQVGTEDVPPPSYLSVVEEQRLKGRSQSVVERLPTNVIHDIFSRIPLLDLYLNIRHVSRLLFASAMSILRDACYEKYMSNARSGYSSDPYGVNTHNHPHVTPIPRELKTLDHFITASMVAALRSSESESLHLFTTKSFYQHQLQRLSLSTIATSTSASAATEENRDWKDIFDLMQPKSRIEDLVISGLYSDEFRRVSHGGNSTSNLYNSTETDKNKDNHQHEHDHHVVIPQDISIRLTLKSVSLLLPFSSSSSTTHVIQKPIIEVARSSSSSSLESLARLIIDRLNDISPRLRRHSRVHNHKSIHWYSLA